MRTVVDNLQEMADELGNLLEALLLNHSAIYRWNEPGSPVVSITVYGDYAYEGLGEEGCRIQAKLLEEYHRFQALLKVLLSGQSKESRKTLSEADHLLQRTIEQEHTWCESTQEALDKALEALQTQVGLLRRLYDPAEGQAVYVPDTNALLYNPRLETWTFADTPKFAIVLLPTVLSELDTLKINHRNPTVRNKAETLIRMIKEYRRRGALREGVPLVRGASEILTIATEPKMGDSLPWLDPESKDDRLLAGVVEVMRSRPHSPVTLITGDINVQNKADFARVPYVEPPKLPQRKGPSQ